MSQNVMQSSTSQHQSYYLHCYAIPIFENAKQMHLYSFLAYYFIQLLMKYLLWNKTSSPTSFTMEIFHFTLFLEKDEHCQQMTGIIINSKTE